MNAFPMIERCAIRSVPDAAAPDLSMAQRAEVEPPPERDPLPGEYVAVSDRGREDARRD